MPTTLLDEEPKAQTSERRIIWLDDEPQAGIPRPSPKREIIWLDQGQKPGQQEQPEVPEDMPAPKQGAIQGAANAFAQAAVKGAAQTPAGALLLGQRASPTGEWVGMAPPASALVPSWSDLRPAKKPSAAEQLKELQEDPISQWSKRVSDAAEETYPVAEENKGKFMTEGAGMAGGFLTIAASGPMAPVQMAAEAAGRHMMEDFKNLVDQGMDKEDAAGLTLKRATASGMGQGLVFSVLPAPLRSAAEKYIARRFGQKALARFIGEGLATGAEGAAVGGASAAAENVATGQPAGQDVVSGGAGLAAVNLLLHGAGALSPGRRAAMTASEALSTPAKSPEPESIAMPEPVKAGKGRKAAKGKKSKTEPSPAPALPEKVEPDVPTTTTTPAAPAAVAGAGDPAAPAEAGTPAPAPAGTTAGEPVDVSDWTGATAPKEGAAEPVKVTARAAERPAPVVEVPKPEEPVKTEEPPTATAETPPPSGKGEAIKTRPGATVEEISAPNPTVEAEKAETGGADMAKAKPGKGKKGKATQANLTEEEKALMAEMEEERSRNADRPDKPLGTAKKEAVAKQAQAESPQATTEQSTKTEAAAPQAKVEQPGATPETPATQKSPVNPKQGKAQKKFLLAELDKAIGEAQEGVVEQAPKAPKYDENAERSIERYQKNQEVLAANKAKLGTITIEIPGDGVFTVLNEKNALKEFRKKAKDFPVSGTRSTESKAPREDAMRADPIGKASPDDIGKALETHVSDDPMRKVLHFAFSDGKETYASNGRILLRVFKGHGGSPGNLVGLDPKTLKPVKVELEKDQKIPDFRASLPDQNKLSAWFKDVDTGRLFNILQQAKQAVSERTHAIDIYRNKDGSYGIRAGFDPSAGTAYEHNVQPGAKSLVAVDPDNLETAINAMRRLGNEKVTISGQDKLSAFVVSGKGGEVAIMPMEIEGAAGFKLAAEWKKREAKDLEAPKSEPAPEVKEGTASLVNPPANELELGSGVWFPKKLPRWMKWRDKVMTELDRITGRHSAKKQTSFYEASRAQKDLMKAIPDEKVRNAISVWREAGGDMGTLRLWESEAKGKMFKQAVIDAQRLTPEQLAWAKKVAKTFDVLGKRGVDHSVLSTLRDNYVTHIWPVNKPGSGFAGRAAKNKFRFAKARQFKTFFSGDQIGWTPRTLDIAKILPAYMHEMNIVIADKQAIKEIVAGHASDGRSPLAIPLGMGKHVTDADTGKESFLVFPKARPKVKVKRKFGKDEPLDTSKYQPMPEQPALTKWTWATKDSEGKPIMVQGDLALHPEARRRVHAMMGQSRITRWLHDEHPGGLKMVATGIRGFDTAQRVMKREMFGLGSMFHPVQEGWHGVGHLINPLYELPKPDMSLYGYRDAAEHGLMLLPDRTTTESYLEGVGSRSIWLSKLLRMGPKITQRAGELIDAHQDWMFHHYIPALKFKTYDALLRRNRELYAEELKNNELNLDDIKFLSAQQANAAYGHLNYAIMDRSPTIQHLMSWAMLAPDFFEARSRFVGQAVQGLTSKVGWEQTKAVAILAMAQAGGAYVVANLIGGKWDWRHPFEVVYKGRRYTFRSIPEDLFSMANDTMQFIHGRVSPLLGKGALQIYEGRNYRGEEVGKLETMAELLANYIPITARSLPGIRQLTETSRKNPISPLEQFAGSMGLRISKYSPITETFKNAEKWQKANGLAKPKGVYPISKYQQLRYALEDGDMERAAEEKRKLLESLPKNDPRGTARQRLSAGFKQSILHPYTGSAKTDEAFAKSLSGYQKELYLLAKKKRQEILWRFENLR